MLPAERVCFYVERIAARRFGSVSLRRESLLFLPGSGLAGGFHGFALGSAANGTSGHGWCPPTKVAREEWNLASLPEHSIRKAQNVLCTFHFACKWMMGGIVINLWKSATAWRRSGISYKVRDRLADMVGDPGDTSQILIDIPTPIATPRLTIWPKQLVTERCIGCDWQNVGRTEPAGYGRLPVAREHRVDRNRNTNWHSRRLVRIPRYRRGSSPMRHRVLGPQERSSARTCHGDGVRKSASSSGVTITRGAEARFGARAARIVACVQISDIMIWMRSDGSAFIVTNRDRHVRTRLQRYS